MPAATSNRHKHLPACGKCGYPAQGISTLNCPECGADLREVGIYRPGQGKGGGLIVLALLAYTIVFFIFCGAMSEVIEANIPHHGKATAHIDLESQNAPYNLSIEIEVTETHWGYSRANSLYFNTNGSTPLQISLDNLTPEMQIDALSMIIKLDTIPRGASAHPILWIDPATAIASWQGLDGKPHQSSGPISEQDVLDFLGDAGLGKTAPQASADAKQLYILMQGLAQRQTQFSLTGFASYSQGASSNYGGAPDWAWPLYIAVCILLWVVGLIAFYKRTRRRQFPALA